MNQGKSRDTAENATHSFHFQLSLLVVVFVAAVCAVVLGNAIAREDNVPASSSVSAKNAVTMTEGESRDCTVVGNTVLNGHVIVSVEVWNSRGQSDGFTSGDSSEGKPFPVGAPCKRRVDRITEPLGSLNWHVSPFSSAVVFRRNPESGFAP